MTSLLHEALKKMNTRQKRPSINDIGSYFGFYDPPLPTLVESSRIYTGQYTFPNLLLNDEEKIREEKKILSTEGIFRKSTFCTLTEAKPGFDRHWVMPEIILLNGTFTMLEMTAFLLNTFFNSMHWCKSATLKIANLAILNHYMVLLNQCL